jgi:hypothetical protein
MAVGTSPDDDGISDGGEDINHNGSVDYGESDPNNRLSPNTGSNPNESSGRGDGGGVAVFPLPPSSFRQKASFCQAIKDGIRIDFEKRIL